MSTPLGSVNETPQMEARSGSHSINSNSTRNPSRYAVVSGGSLPYSAQGSNYPAVSSGKKAVVMQQAPVPPAGMVPAVGAAPGLELRNKSLEEEVKQYA